MESTVSNVVAHLAAATEEMKKGIEEVGKLQEVENKLKTIEETVTSLSSKLEEMKIEKKGSKVAFSASLRNGDCLHVGPFGSLTPLVFEHVFTNIGEAYDQKTGIFTAPLHGVYAFRIFCKAFGHGKAAVTPGLFKNGQHIISAHSHQSAGIYGCSNGVTLELKKGDQVNIQLYPTSWIYDNRDHHTTFSGHLLFTL